VEKATICKYWKAFCIRVFSVQQKERKRKEKEKKKKEKKKRRRKNGRKSVKCSMDNY